MANLAALIAADIITAFPRYVTRSTTMEAPTRGNEMKEEAFGFQAERVGFLFEGR